MRMRKFLLIWLLALPGIFSLIPLLDPLYLSLKAQMIPALMPGYTLFMLISLSQTLFLVTIATISGVFLAEKMGFHDDCLNAIVQWKDIRQPLRTQWIPALVYTLPAAIIFLGLIYVALPAIQPEEAAAIYRLRQQGGPLASLLYGGIDEEVLLRWGLLPLLVWFGTMILRGAMPTAVRWTAVIFTGLIFAWGHIPAYTCRIPDPSMAYLAVIIGLNLYAGVFFGWIFWRFGILSAMAAHMLFHVIWYGADHFLR